MEGWKTLVVSFAAFLVGIGGLVDLPILAQIANALTANVDALLVGVGAIFGFLRMISDKPAAISLK
jgi:hypothetical protein